MKQRYTYRAWNEVDQEYVYRSVIVEGGNSQECFEAAVRSGAVGELIEIADVIDCQQSERKDTEQ